MAKIAITIIALVLTTCQAMAEPVYVKGKFARLRSGPGTNYQILWEAKRYTPLENLAMYKDWYVVRDYEGDVGWVHKQVIGNGKSAIVIKSKANVRKGPGTKFDKVYEVPKKYLLKILETKGDWYKVVDEDKDEGWINASLVWVSK